MRFTLYTLRKKVATFTFLIWEGCLIFAVLNFRSTSQDPLFPHQLGTKVT